jgi:hypothetical protein
MSQELVKTHKPSAANLTIGDVMYYGHKTVRRMLGFNGVIGRTPRGDFLELISLGLAPFIDRTGSNTQIWWRVDDIDPLRAKLLANKPAPPPTIEELLANLQARVAELERRVGGHNLQIPLPL